MTAWWCVLTESGRRHVLAYEGNGGFGPVSAWDNGQLVHPIARHRIDGVDCPTCPQRAGTYLPMLSWDTPDPDRGSEPGSGHPDRGAFTATFRGGPDYPDQPMLARVARQNWWRSWERYCVIDLDPQDWRAKFDAWRRHRTGYRADCTPPVR